MRSMHPMRRHRRAAALAAVAALALGATACSDDEDPIDPDEDEAVIEDAIITLDDLPDGFEETDDEDDDDEDEEEAEEACQEAAGIDPDELENNEVVDGEDAEFQREVPGESLLGITVGITSFEDRDLAAESLEILSEDDYLDCGLETMTESAAEDGTDLGDVSVEAIDPVFDGDAAGSFRVEFETQGFPTVIEQHLVLVDRFGISLQVVSVNEESDDDLVEELLETMADRIEDATA
jgi:hypothetical protein